MNKANFMQTTELGDLKGKFWKNHPLLRCKKKEKILAATLIEEEPVLMGRKIFYAPRGFLIDYHNFQLLKFFVENLKEFVKKEKRI